MRLVVDTNVFISAALKQSSWPAQTIRWVSQFGGLLKSEATEQELIAVLQRPRFAGKFPPWFVPEVRRMLDAAEPVPIVELLAYAATARTTSFSNSQSMGTPISSSAAVPISFRSIWSAAFLS